MKVSDAIKQRRSIRIFKDTPVPKKTVKEILNLARLAPTGGNMQPWDIAVVQGEVKKKLTQECLEVINDRQIPDPEIPYYPSNFDPPYGERRHLMGKAIYLAKGIKFSEGYVDWHAVMEFNKLNFSFYGADVGLLFLFDNRVEKGSLLDIGMFMQNIMLLALEYGLATCPLASWGNYPKQVKRVLNIGEDYKIICGMALGHADKEAKVNVIPPVRLNVDEFTRWFD